MEDIQGVAIARCYGFFTVEIESNSEVLDGAGSDADYDEECATACNDKTFISVLVLERLGDVIPINIPLKALKPHEIYSDMDRFGIEHMNIRWRNILAAPAAQQSTVCPYHGHMHRWRVVDFDLSRKSNHSHSHIESASGSWLRTILDGLEEPYVVEPWD
ncbi:hypothetical protein JB92DRAFT_3035459 [Gautieria morchelliformis]|nr:hypothetical protein JB92DRAFT_3035459 [Gautieria morchelliformis]